MSGMPFPNIGDIPEIAKLGALKTLADGTLFAFALQAKLKYEIMHESAVKEFLDTFQKKHPKAVLVSCNVGNFEYWNKFMAVYYELEEE